MDARHQARSISNVTCAIVTLSDSRTAKTDTSGSLIRERLEAAGHTVCAQTILPDDPARVREEVITLCADPRCRAILMTGGTGIAQRDTTYEAVCALLEKRLDGFGELFRVLSYQEIGAAAMLSRAVAGTRGRTAIFSMPGSPQAVRLVMEKLILPQLGHIAALLS